MRNEIRERKETVATAFKARKNFGRHLIASLLALMILWIPLASALCDKYPRGIGHTADVEMYAIEVDDTGTKIILGGKCDAAGLCGPDKPTPLLQLWDTSSIANYVWSLYVPNFSGTNYDKV